MKNRFIKCCFAFILITTCFILVSCDLSHKHYFDDYGKCRNCGVNTCKTLTKDSNSNTYSYDYVKINTKDDGFFKFVSNGENGIKITFTKNQSTSIGETTFKKIKFYSENSAIITSNVERSELEYNGQLTAGVTYYIWLDIENYACDISLTVSELN